MNSNNKSDMSTSGSEGPHFPSGPRGTTFLERPGSHRESIANRIQSSALGTTRSAATSAHGDPLNFVQSLISDVKQVVPEKLPRPAEMKRIMGAFAGSISDELGPGWHASVSKEEVKRTRSRLAEGFNKASERIKTLHQAISRIDKQLYNSPRKRSRVESSGDRPGGMSGPGISRTGRQIHSSNADETEMGPPKEERTKNPGQNRRARTSTTEMDARNVGASRSLGAVDKTRDISKINNRNTGEEKTQGLAAWQKPRMKKKRSVLKTDASNSVGLTRSIDEDRERRQESLPKLGGDARLKVTGPHSSRYGVSLSAGGCGKADTEQGGLESPRPLPKFNQDGGALSINKRDRLGGFEIGNLKAINKLTDQEGSPSTTISRTSSSTRGPRSTHAALPKAHGGMLRTPDSDVWDQPSPSNKSGPSAGGGSSSKRAKSALSPSPPVAQWASHRPLKMSRGARRSNIVPITGSQGGEPMADLLENKTMAMASQATNRMKKGDHAQSSSEESGLAVPKLKDNKRKRVVEAEGNNSLNSQRLGTASHPLKKNKLVMEDDIGEVVVRKQGRGGCGFGPPRRGRPSSVEKPEANGTTTKQRSARPGIEGRPGRPPVKKFSERRGKSRAREVAVESPLDSSGQPEDDREELLAAANAALAQGHASTDVFWKQNEPYFRFLSDEDMSFLTKEVACVEEQIHCTKTDEQDLSKKDNPNYVSLPSTPNGHGPYSNGGKTAIIASENDPVEPILEQLVQGMDAGPGAGSDTRSLTSFSICQKLMSAIISEEDLERFECNGHDSNIFYIELEEGWLGHQESERNQLCNGVRLDVLSVDCPYEQMSINDRILLELSQIGIYPDPCEHVPSLRVTDEDDISDEIAMLEDKLAKEALGTKVALTRVEQKAQAVKETQEREFMQLALDKLIIKANEKYLASRGKHGSRAARQSAMGFINRSLVRCKEFESNGTSCFEEVSFKELLLNSVSKQSNSTQNEDKSPQDLLLDKDEQWSAGVKKELLLDEVVGNITGSVSLGSGMKGKRSERDARGNNKNGRASSSNPKGDRKPKAKPKQRSASTNTLLSNGTAELAPRSNSNKREGLPPLPTKPGSKQIEEGEEELEALPDLSSLQLPDMGDLVGDMGDLVGDTGGDGTDFWSGVDIPLNGDDGDCIGLDIPLDDLSDLGFSFN